MAASAFLNNAPRAQIVSPFTYVLRTLNGFMDAANALRPPVRSFRNFADAGSRK